MDIATEEHFGPRARALTFERGTDGPRVILVGLDGSPTASRATAYALGLARRQRSRLVVVYVAPTPTLGGTMSGVVAGAMASTVDDLVAELRAEVRRAAEELGVSSTFVIRRGDAFVELCEVADAVRADLVVVGVSTQAGHRFVGSVATRLVRRGRWPVVVVP